MKAAPFLLLAVLLGIAPQLPAQTSNPPGASNPSESDTELEFVVMISRHGVRSPTGKVDQLNRYAAQPWPQWSVPPGDLTEHGAKLITLFGAYDREFFHSQGLLSATGCEDAKQVTIVADSDQRTRETGKALVAGLFPGCSVEVHALPEAVQDPLFHPPPPPGNSSRLLAAAAVAGRIGDNPAGLTAAYRTQLDELETVLTGCARNAPCAAGNSAAPRSLFDIPAAIEPGKGDHIIEFRGPLATAGTMAENLLLEYSDGMPQVGWGRVDANQLRDLMQLHTASSDLERRTEIIARLQSANLLSHVLDSMQQAITNQPVPGALSKPGDRLLILVGHDTNLANISGALGLSWLIDGRRDDTPPGGALVFELRYRPGPKTFEVRAYYTAQSLDQMRNATPLTLAAPPPRANVFLPACSTADPGFSCRWTDFQKILTTMP